MEMGSTSLQRFSIKADDPLSAQAEYEWQWEYARGTQWSVRTWTRTELTCDRDRFFLKAVCVAWEQGEEVFTKQWDKQYARDCF